MASPASPASPALEAPPARAAERARPASGRLGRLRRDRTLLLLCVPGVLYFVLFFYIPLSGNVIAFKDYQPFLGVGGSDWVGFDNFSSLVSDDMFWTALWNTLQITVIQLVFYFPAPIALALLLNSLIGQRVKRLVQTVVYLPHFLSWVVVVAMFQQVVGGAGSVTHLLIAHGVNIGNVMTDPGSFKVLVTKKAGTARVETMLKVLDYLAAPFGTTEAEFINFGVEGTHFTRDGAGNPKLNAKGEAEVLTTWQPASFLMNSPEYLYLPGHEDRTKLIHDVETQALAMMGTNPCLGHYSDTDTNKGAGLTSKLRTALEDIIAGRQPLSNLDAVRKDWRSKGGDAIRGEYEKAIAAG